MVVAAPMIVVVGDVITDLIVRPREPIAAASDTRAAIAVRPGGSGANTAAWLAVQRAEGLDLNVHFVGRVGRDPFGVYHDGELRRHGVTPHLAIDERRSTGTIVALVDATGERAMLTDRGANLGLQREDLPRDLFRPGANLHLSGYTLFEPETRDAALTALAWARERGITISVDPSSASLLAAVGPAHFLQWTRGADLCFPNLDEGRILSGETDPEAIARALSAWYGAVVLTMGATGALWARAGEPLLMRAAEQVEVIDSTGAGDAFCAGFLARWLTGASPSDALAAGARLGAAAAGRIGARPGPPLGP